MRPVTSRRRSQGQREVAADVTQVIGLRVGSEEYALRISAVQEVITAPRITRVPKSARHIKGVVNLRGNVIPVLDVAARLGIGETRMGEGSRIVAVESKGELVGLAAESVSKVTRVAESDVKPPPPLVGGIEARYLDGVARLGDRFLVFLSLERVLAEGSCGDGAASRE